MVDGDEPREPVCVREPVEEHPRRTGMIDFRHGPVQRLTGTQAFVADSGIVREATPRGLTELGEHRLGVRGEPAVRLAEQCGEAGDHVEVGAHARRRGNGTFPQQYPAFEIGHRAVLLGPLGHREHDVRERSRLRQHEIRDHEQIQGGEPIRDVRGVRRGHDQVAAEHHQRLGTVFGTERVKQFVGRTTGARQ